MGEALGTSLAADIQYTPTLTPGYLVCYLPLKYQRQPEKLKKKNSILYHCKKNIIQEDTAEQRKKSFSAIYRLSNKL